MLLHLPISMYVHRCCVHDDMAPELRLTPRLGATDKGRCSFMDT